MIQNINLIIHIEISRIGRHTRTKFEINALRGKKYMTIVYIKQKDEKLSVLGHANTESSFLIFVSSYSINYVYHILSIIYQSPVTF